MKDKLTYYLGRRSKRFRLWYHKTFERYQWGVFQFIQDFSGSSKEPLTTSMIEKFFDDIRMPSKPVEYIQATIKTSGLKLITQMVNENREDKLEEPDILRILTKGL